MTPITRATLVALLIAIAAYPSSAWGARPATPAETESLVSWAPPNTNDEFVTVDCVTARISTKRPAWAVLNTGTCFDYAYNMVFAMRNAAWTHIPSANNTSTDLACPSTPDVPLDVQYELGLCRKPTSYIVCRPNGNVVQIRRPKVCLTLGSTGSSFATSVNLVSIAWSAWGGPIARASGIERGFHLPLQSIPVAIVAFARKTDESGDFRYSKLRVASKHGSIVVNAD